MRPKNATVKKAFVVFRHEAGLFDLFWQSILGTRDPISHVLVLNYSIGQISGSDVQERGAEEFPLTKRCDTGNNDDHSGMQGFLSMENKKVRAIVRYKRVVLHANGSHQLPVFRTAEAEIVDMIGGVTGGVRHVNQGSVQAFIN